MYVWKSDQLNGLPIKLLKLPPLPPLPEIAPIVCMHYIMGKVHARPLPILGSDVDRATLSAWKTFRVAFPFAVLSFHSQV